MAARQLNNFIFFTIAGCCFSVIILGAALGTTHWVEVEARSSSNGAQANSGKVNYGLASGSKTINSFIGGSVTLDLKVTCRSKENICMYSCGVSKEERKADLEALWLGEIYNVICEEGGSTRDFSGFVATRSASEINATRDKKMFLNFGLWLVTILLLVGAILFSLIAGLQALYNTFRAPSLPLFSVFGLYIWNGISAGCTLLAMILWGVAFTNLKDNPAISETIVTSYKADSTSLGYSFWILILAELFNLGNIGIIKYRSWKIYQIENKVKVVQDKSNNPTNLLY